RLEPLDRGVLAEHADAVLGGNALAMAGAVEVRWQVDVRVAELALAVHAQRALQVETAPEKIALAQRHLCARIAVGAVAEREPHFERRALAHRDLHWDVLSPPRICP